MKITCICGNELIIREEETTVASELMNIKVMPCEVCIREAEIAGYDEGYDQGKSESEN